jgi:hypothetical protein
MTLTPMYEAIRCETSRKPSIREKPAEILGSGHQCKDVLLPSIKHNGHEERYPYQFTGARRSLLSVGYELT